VARGSIATATQTSLQLIRLTRVIAGFFGTFLVIGSASGQPSVAAAPDHGTKSAPSYAPASLQVPPGSLCLLSDASNPTGSSLSVVADDDGYVRFHAVRARHGETTEHLTLKCTNNAGESSTHSVDLTSETTFVPRTLDVMKERGVDRPALTGDPLRLESAELVRSG